MEEEDQQLLTNLQSQEEEKEECFFDEIGGTMLPPLSVAQLLGIYGQIVSGVASLHARGIVHYDLKCCNVLVDESVRLPVRPLPFPLRRLLVGSGGRGGKGRGRLEEKSCVGGRSQCHVGSGRVCGVGTRFQCRVGSGNPSLVGGEEEEEAWHMAPSKSSSL